MTFLQILNWMSESEENVAVCPDEHKYKVISNELKVLKNKRWVSVGRHIINVTEGGWSKSEPAPEEVDINGYIKLNGEMCFALKDSEADKNYSIDGDWRKVKVRFS